MVGIGETYLAAFAIAAGFSDFTVGLLVTVPVLGGSLLQLSTSRGVRWLGSYRRWVVAAASLQTMSMCLLMTMALLGRAPLGLVFAAATLYWAGGLAAGPAWNAWVEHLVPNTIRASFWPPLATLPGQRFPGLGTGRFALAQA